MSVSLTRRALLAGGAASFVSLASYGEIRAFARGRLPVSGRVALHVPWPLATIDPHRIDDPAAALFGEALFDTLYARDDGGAIVSSLAESDPEIDKGNLRVALRSGLRTAFDRPIDARDVVASIARARSLGARGWLAEIPTPRADGRNALLFPMRDGAKLTRALASPLASIVPIGFAGERPDGTGPFRAERRGDALALVKNARASRGPALLDEILVRPSPDLAASLRAFEAGADDIGWLGSGLHEPRPGAKPFDMGAVAWAVLRTGKEAGAWDAPGIAQRICDGIPPTRLSYLVLGAPWRAEAEEGWGGATCDLLVRDDAPWLIELAHAVAATIARPSHVVTAKPIPVAEIAQRRTTRGYALMIDVVRPLGQGALGAFLALATSDDLSTVADVAKHAPRLAEGNVRTLPRTMRLGILGEIRAQGGRLADLALTASTNAGLDFGTMTRARKSP